MKRFMVRVIKVYYQPVVVEATNEKDAVARVRAGKGDWTRRKIDSHTLSHHKWRAYEIDKRGRAI